MAWVGLLVMALGLPLSFSSSWTWVSTGTLGSGAGYFVTLCTGAAGALLALVGGLITRTKYFWIVSIVVGVAYISSFYGYGVGLDEPYKYWGVFAMLLPGLACMVEGIVIWKLNKQAQSRQSH
jgi:hypothetical protein